MSSNSDTNDGIDSTRRGVLSGIAGLTGTLAGASIGTAAAQTTAGSPTDLQSAVRMRNWRIGPESELPADSDGSAGDLYLADNGQPYIHDGSQWHQMGLRAPDINTVRYVDGTRGAGEVQARINDLASIAAPDNRIRLVVRGDGQADWEESVDNQDNIILEATDSFSVNVADVSGLSSQSIYGGSQEYVLGQIGCSGAELRNWTIDYNEDGSTRNVNAAAIHVFNSDGSRVVDCTGKNPPNGDHGTGSYNSYGIFVGESQDCELLRCVGENAGYEHIGVRGDCSGTVVRDCEGWGTNSVHSFQIARVAGTGIDQTQSGRPHDVDVIRFKGDNRILVHGTGSHVAEGIRFDSCETTDVVEAIGHAREVRFVKNQAKVQLRATGASTRLSATVTNPQDHGRDTDLVELIGPAGNDDVEMEVTVRDADVVADRRILRIEDNSSATNDYRATLENCYNDPQNSGIAMAFVVAANVPRLDLRDCEAGPGATEVTRAQSDGAVIQEAEFQNVEPNGATLAATASNGIVETVVEEGKRVRVDLAGAAPDATNYPEGVKVIDVSNDATYYIDDNSASGGYIQLA